RVAVVKPLADDRYDPDALATHDGRTLGATALRSAQELLHAARGADLVIIDEVHFFGAALAGPVEQLLASGVAVAAAGLETDHRGAVFEPMDRLLHLATVVTRLTCPCAVCGGPATHTQRLTPGGGRIVVGGPGMYEARCAGCFRPGV
ncbi:MAG: thymidine kinase, partial [Phycisphaerae bacterium]|nr:thymidine kinase [Phycisphaerae bacterium]